jgi:hypothetical protein
MKLLIATLLILTTLAGCAITTTSSTPVRGARDRSSEDCRGVWDNLANVCIGG